MSIFAPIADVMGWIFDKLFIGLNTIGIGNVAVAIVIFTILIKVLMIPLTISQQKMSKLTSYISPEVKAIQEKYKDKRSDSAAMVKMQEEMKAVYDKYGTSQMAGCVQLLIQLPILMSLYSVFRQIPLYIGSIKELFLNMGIFEFDGYAEKLSQIMQNVDFSNKDQAIVALNNFNADQWNQVKEAFPSISETITQNLDKISDVNTFLGINMSINPDAVWGKAIIIPVLAGLTQFISVKIAQGNSNAAMDDDNPAAASMKMMTYVMPLMSAFIAISVPAGLGLYWIATAVVQTIIQLIINAYYDKIGVDEVVRRNIEKRNKKRAKKGLPAETLQKNASKSTKNISQKETTEEKIQRLQAKKEANDKKIQEIKESTKYYKTAKPGSLAEKAGMVAKYNEKSDKKKK